MCPSDQTPTTNDDVWIEIKHDALGLAPDAKVAFSNGKLFRISASGSLLELGVAKTLAEAGKIKLHDAPAGERVRAPRTAFK